MNVSLKALWRTGKSLLVIFFLGGCVGKPEFRDYTFSHKAAADLKFDKAIEGNQGVLLFRYAGVNPEYLEICKMPCTKDGRVKLTPSRGIEYVAKALVEGEYRFLTVQPNKKMYFYDEERYVSSFKTFTISKEKINYIGSIGMVPGLNDIYFYVADDHVDAVTYMEKHYPKLLNQLELKKEVNCSMSNNGRCLKSFAQVISIVRQG